MTTPSATKVRRRPRVGWFVLGGALLLAAVVAFGAGLALTVSSASETDGTLRTGSGEAEVEAPAGERRMLFAPEGEPVPDCTVRDGSGERTLEEPWASTTVTTGGREWEGFATFDSGDGDLRVTPVVRARCGWASRWARTSSSACW